MKHKALLLSFLFILTSCKKNPELIKLSGFVFGTAYNIQYIANENYQSEIDSLFNEVNQSLSTYDAQSDISKINRNEIDSVDVHFKVVFEASRNIYLETKGAFDPTIGNVVNAWNFGAEENKFKTDSITIDSLMRFVGFNKVKLKNNQLIKTNPAVYLEFNAIAKGYGIDVIANFLASKGIDNYLVEIGGDLVVKGINITKQQDWTIGIDDPNFDGSQTYSKVITLKNQGMATSGTYRKFKVDSLGNRYAHIIDTKTGYPSKTNILSVSVIAPNAMLADGYATAFQAMGIEAVKDFLKKHPELKVYFIFEDNNKALNTLSLNGFPE